LAGFFATRRFANDFLGVDFVFVARVFVTADFALFATDSTFAAAFFTNPRAPDFRFDFVSGRVFVNSPEVAPATPPMIAPTAAPSGPKKEPAAAPAATPAAVRVALAPLACELASAEVFCPLAFVVLVLDISYPLI
jgi:hypothetical protein